MGVVEPPPLPPPDAEAEPEKPAPRRKQRRGLVPLLILTSLGTLAGLLLIADRLQRQRRYERALRMVEHGQHARAIPYLISRLERWPDDVDLRFALARALGGAERWPEAVTHLEKLIELDASHGEGHRLLGRALLTLKEPVEAEPHLRAATELLPEDPTAWTLLGQLHLQAGQPIDAESALRQAQATGRPSGITEAWLGQALHAQGRTEEALAQLDGALAAYPQVAEVHFQLGEVLRERSSWFVAVERYRAARELGLATLACDLGLAIALHESGALAEAEIELERMTREHDRAPAPWFRLGLLRDQEGDARGALVCFERCLVLDPDHATAREQVQALRRTVGR